jgi:CubicO group peptidase (beta-lactamase class C family)
MATFWNTQRSLASLVVAALAVAACGDADDDIAVTTEHPARDTASSEPSSATSPTTAQHSEPTPAASPNRAPPPTSPSSPTTESGDAVAREPVRVDPSALQAVLETFLARSGAPGGVVAVSIAGAEPVVVASGLADRRNDTPMPDDPLFFTGKIGGQFVTAVALDLIAEEAFSLDDTVAMHLPEAPYGDQVTVRHLLTHTSGFPDWVMDGDMSAALFEAGQDLSHHFTTEELVELVRDRPLKFAPGTDVEHSEFNVLLLRLIIEHVTGRPFATELRDRIIVPLGLQHTADGTDAVRPDQLLPGVVRKLSDLTLRWTTDYDNTSYWCPSTPRLRSRAPCRT